MPENLGFFLPNHGAVTLGVVVFSHTKYTYPPDARHKLTEGLLEEKSSKHSTTCRGNPRETRRKYAGPFASIVVLAYLKDREFV